MEKEFNELRKLLLSIDGKHFTWNDARASVLNQLHDLQSKAENLSISDVRLSVCSVCGKKFGEVKNCHNVKCTNPFQTEA